MTQHRDKLGRSLDLDDFVCFPESGSLSVGKIVKITPKMVRVLGLPRARWESRKYPWDCVKLPPEDMTWFMLKNSTN